MISVAKPAIKDLPSNWSKNFQHPPHFNQERFQNKLNEIAGFTQAGEPVLRLVWGGNESYFIQEGLELIEKPRYATRAGQPLRRWLLEENTDPGQLDAMGGKNNARLQVKERGFYTLCAVIADHSHCPPNCKDRDTVCLGDYREPDETVLNYVRECAFKIAADKHRPDPRKPVTPEMILPYMPKELSDEEKEKKEEGERADYLASWLRTHGVGRTQNTKPS
jgi:hypothetical protein